MMRYHAAGFSDPQQAVDQARAILAMGAAVQAQTPGPFAEVLREEYFRCSAMTDDQLYQLVFSEHHQPSIFTSSSRRLLKPDCNLGASTSLGCRPREPAAVRAFQ